MLILAGYLHSARGMHLQAYDGALFAIYMAFRWVYPWFFYWPLGRYVSPFVSCPENGHVVRHIGVSEPVVVGLDPDG